MDCLRYDALWYLSGNIHTEFQAINLLSIQIPLFILEKSVSLISFGNTLTFDRTNWCLARVQQIATCRKAVSVPVSVPNFALRGHSSDLS